MACRPDKAPPSFPLYYKDAYTDAQFVALSWDAQGLFWRLACWQWDDGDIPADVDLVCAIVGKPKETRKLWPEMERLFLPVDDRPGRLRNRRTHELREEMLDKRRKQKDGANLTNQKRWGVVPAPAPKQPDPPPAETPTRKLTPQQEAVGLVLDAFAEELRPHPGIVARWIGQMCEGRNDPNPIPAAEAVREIVWKNPTKPADYIGKCVGTAATKARTKEANATTGAATLGRFKPRSVDLGGRKTGTD